MMFPKQKRGRLKGKALAQLNKEIHDRDRNICILCGCFVLSGEKFHHEPSGQDKEDRIECGVTLCGGCHHERHFGAKLREYRRKCEEYLKRKYPEYWSNKRGA